MCVREWCISCKYMFMIQCSHLLLSTNNVRAELKMQLNSTWLNEWCEEPTRSQLSVDIRQNAIVSIYWLRASYIIMQCFRLVTHSTGVIKLFIVYAGRLWCFCSSCTLHQTFTELFQKNVTRWAYNMMRRCCLYNVHTVKCMFIGNNWH